jgi:maleylpyruvate isomerase
MLKLYTYFRSSASYRVRIALNFKGLDYESLPIHLLREGGEQFKPFYRDVNPQSLVPALVTEEGHYIYQSLAIIEYLEEVYPTPALIPGLDKPLERARVRGLCLAIACEIHPLNNLRVLKYLKEELQFRDSQKMQWYHHWLEQGFNAIEKDLASQTQRGNYACGDQVTWADIFLVPQVYNAERFGFNMEPYPEISKVCAACNEIEAFQKAQPHLQPDFEE